jgi:leucine dehydrogenase
MAIAEYLETFEHDALLVRRGRRSDLLTIVAVHSTARGPALGGCRMWNYTDSRAAVRDALRLSRAMTFKAAVADLPLGGGKGVIMLPSGVPPPEGEERRAVLLDFGETVETLGGAYITAEDVGTSEPDMRVIAEVTEHVSGLATERGGSGDPSPWTALGVEAAIRVACERVWGAASLEGRSVAVLGLGHVGAPLARLLADGGAELVVADIDERRRAIAEELGARWTDPDAALAADVDVLAPCALGGVLNEETVPLLRCRAIAGAANNQLAAEPVGELLAARRILWVPDFVANAGGIINISVELEPGAYAPDRAEARVRAVGDTARRVLDHADATGATPLAAAMEIARSRVTAAAVAGRREPSPASW